MYCSIALISYVFVDKRSGSIDVSLFAVAGGLSGTQELQEALAVDTLTYQPMNMASSEQTYRPTPREYSTSCWALLVAILLESQQQARFIEMSTSLKT